MNSYQLLSEIYRLLAEIDPLVITSAEQQALDPQIKQILKAFSGALLSSPDRRQAPLFPTGRPSEHVPGRYDEHLPSTARYAVLSSGIRTESSDNLVEYFLHLTPKLTNRELVRLFNRSGLPTRARPKETRRAVVRRIVRDLERLPTQTRNETLKRLRSLLDVDETSGWMNIIRSFSKE